MTGLWGDKSMQFVRPLFAFVVCTLPGVASFGQNLTPDQAISRMKLADGLKARIVASEPLVRQPVAIDFDDRGRLWAIQYLQYPNPAGLNRVNVDRYSRTVYDRMPEPHPRGPKGADRLTILEDTDGDGIADKARDFVTGLNLSTGFAFGDGGVYVLQAPYLLHYADADGDDVPDGDPRVLLSGFGMEDAHSLANSITWGEDGWLYGLQGSTVTAKIRGIEFQQGIWRYHPSTDRFELFAEGGGNMWGLDFDAEGNLFASTNFGPHIALHVMQDAYYWKQFGKHGPLHNPYAFGHFDHMTHANPQGGHVIAGGLFYLADHWPERYRGQFIGANVLSHWVGAYEFRPKDATFESSQSGILLDSGDPWFAPCDLAMGPDGNVYVADWHDERMAHPDPDADWDRTNGRIYVIKPIADDRPALAARKDLNKVDSAELIDELKNPNAFVVRRARRILKERNEASSVKRLNALWQDRSQPIRLRREAFRTVVSTLDRDPKRTPPLGLAEFEIAVADPDFAIRRLAAQALGDFATLPAAERVALIARPDDDPKCLGQRIASLARVDAPDTPKAWARLALQVDRNSVSTNRQRLWWAADKISDRAAAPLVEAIRLMTRGPDRSRNQATASGHDAVSGVVIPNLIRKFAYRGQESEKPLILTLIRTDLDRYLPPLLEAIRGGAPKPAGELREFLTEAYRKDDSNLVRWEIAARLGNDEARRYADNRFRNEKERTSEEFEVAFLRTAADSGWSDWNRNALQATSRNSPSVRDAGWNALARLMDNSTIRETIALYTRSSDDTKRRIRELLLSRTDSCELLLKAVSDKTIPQQDFALTEVAAIDRLGSDDLNRRVLAIWGKVAHATPEDRLAEARRLNNDLRAGSGDAAKGQTLFANNCAGCHRLHDVGRAVGPDLTGANRSDRQWLLTSIVDPSGVIRKEYQSRIIEMKDGRVLEGLLVESSGGLWSLMRSDGETISIAASEIRESRESPVSVMPEGLYRRFDPKQLRDLFAFLQSMEKPK